MSGGRLAIHTGQKGISQYFWYHGIPKNSYYYCGPSPELSEQVDAYKLK